MWVWDHVEVLLVGVVFVLAILAKLDPVLFSSLANIAIGFMGAALRAVLIPLGEILNWIADGLQQVF